MIRLKTLPQIFTAKNLPFLALTFLLLLALLIGGASRANVLSRLVLNSVSIISVAAVYMLPGPAPVSRKVAPCLILIGALIGWATLQLVPLPPSLWKILPGREHIASGFELLGQTLPFAPISLTPDRTWRAILGFVPPLACFLIAMKCTNRQLMLLLLFGACIIAPLSVTLGILQIFSGETSPLYFHAVTNHGSPVGFFANANHQAIFLVTLIPLICLALKKSRSARKSGVVDSGLSLCVGAILVYNVIGIVAAGSLAGYLFGVPVLLVSLLTLAFPKSKASPFASTGLLALVLAPVLITFLSPNLSGLGIGHYDGGPGSRSDIYENTIDALWDAAPIGTGLGSFQSVYTSYEDPGALASRFVNHAHNDYLELILELGLVGAVIIAVGLTWLARTSFQIFTTRTKARNHSLKVASTMILWILVAHSFVDYPLRTPAMACLFAVCLLIITKPATLQKSPPMGQATSDTPDDTQPRHAEL